MKHRPDFDAMLFLTHAEKAELEIPPLLHWQFPTGTWFQQRLKMVRMKEQANEHGPARSE